MIGMKIKLQALGVALAFQWTLLSAIALIGYRDAFLEHGRFWMSWLVTSLVLAVSFASVRSGVELFRERLKAAETGKEYYRAVALLFALCALTSFLSIITSTALFDIQGDRRVLTPDLGLITNAFSLIILAGLYPPYALCRLMISHPAPSKEREIHGHAWLDQDTGEMRGVDPALQAITRSARGIYKRLDELGELEVFIREELGDSVQESPWVISWIHGQRIWMTDVIEQLEATSPAFREYSRREKTKYG